MRAYFVWLLLVLAGLGCGGGTSTTESTTATEEVRTNEIAPEALVEFQAGVRAMGRSGRQARAEARQRFEAALGLAPRRLWEARYNLAVIDRQSSLPATTST